MVAASQGKVLVVFVGGSIVDSFGCYGGQVLRLVSQQRRLLVYVRTNIEFRE